MPSISSLVYFRQAFPKALFPASARRALFVLVAMLLPYLGFAQGTLTNGGNHDGTINNDEDAWSFTATAGDAVILRCGELSGTANFTPRILVNGPNGFTVALNSHTSDAYVQFQASLSGTYSVFISSFDSGQTGTYRLRFIKVPGTLTVPSGDEGGALTNGGNHDGATELGDEDAWTFHVNAGESVVLRCGEMSGTTYYYPWIRVYGPNGAFIVSSWDYSDAYVDFRATLSGTYVAVIGTYEDGETGTYRLRFIKAPGTLTVPDGDEGGTLTNGGNHDGTTEMGDEDAWTFSVNAGDSVVLRCGELSGSTYYYPRILVFGPDGSLIVSDWDYSDAYAQFRATLSGTYTALIGTYEQGETGTYRLRYVKAPGTLTIPVGDEGGALTNGGNHNGSTEIGDEDAWTFNVNAGDSVVLRCGELSGSTYYYPRILVFGPNGALIALDWDYADAYVSFRATLSGKYFALIGSYDEGETGTYRLRYIKAPGALTVPGGDEGGALTNGGNHNGTTEIGDEDAWTVYANAGDFVGLRCGELSGTTYYYPYIRVFGPNGAPIASDWDYSDAIINFNATISGTYTVVVGTYDEGETGTYCLRIIRVPGTIIIPPGDEGGALTNGLAFTGTTLIGDEDPWTFNAWAGDTVTLRCLETSGTSYYYPRISVYGPTGTLVASDWDYSEAYVQFQTTVSGKYTVVVGSYDEGESGSYRLTYTRTMTMRAEVIGSGTVTPPSVATPGSTQSFTATPAPGYIVGEWRVDSIRRQIGGNTFTLTNIRDNHLVTVVFRPLIKLYWQNTNGLNAEWRMNGTNYITSAPLPGVAVAWKMVGQSDFNFDGSVDLLFQNSAGQMFLRTMSGTTTLRDTFVRFGQAAPSGWQVKALSDLNNDGHTDFLFQTTTNRLAAWFMNRGTNYLSSALLSSHTPGWKVVGMADFNGDTKKDLLWQHPLGYVSVWKMNGRTNLGPVSLFSNSTATAGWAISALADLDFNGQKDILGQNNKGQVQVWLMNRTNFLKTVLLRNGATNSAPGWQLKGPK
jgi:hypothetical protein